MADNETTTKFKVDISELKSQFQEAQRQIKLVNSEFKSATAGMDSWSTSSDGLSAKVKQMTGVLDSEKAKLESLKQQYALVCEQEGANSKSAVTLATKINNQEAVVKDTEKSLKSYQQQLQDIQSSDVTSFADKVADGLKNAGESVSNFIKDSIKKGVSTLADNLKEASSIGINAVESLAKGIADGITDAVSIGVSAIKTIGSECISAYEEVYEGTENLLLATGAVGDDAEALEESYKSVASSINADFGTIGSAMGEVNTRFGYTGEKLEDCTTQFLKFAEITGTDATSAVQLVSRAMGDAGIDSDDYAEVLDQLAVACQGSGISLDTLASSLTTYGASMRALGFDTSESIAIFSTWEKAGVNTSTAFSGMKKAISNWSSEGKDAREEFKKTLEEIAECPDITSATTKAIEIFGSKAGPDLVDAIRGGRFEYEDFLEVLEKSTDTVTDTFNEIQTGSDKFETATNRLKVQGAEVGEVLTDVGGDLASSLMGSLSDIIDKILEHKDTIVSVVEGTIVPKIIEFKDKLIGEIMPVVIEKFTEFKEKFTEIKDRVKEVIEQNVLPVFEQLKEKVEEILPVIAEKFTEFKEKFTEIKDNVIDAVQNYIVPIFEQLKASAIQVFNSLKNAFQNTDEPLISFKDVLQNVAEKVVPVASDIISGLVEVVGNLISWIIDNKDVVIATLAGIGAGFLAFNVVSMIQGVISVMSALPAVLTAVKGVVIGLNTAISANPIGILIALIAGLIAYFAYLYNTSDEFRELLEIIWQKIKDFFSGIIEKLTPVWEFIKGFGEYLYNWFNENVLSQTSEVFDAIVDAFQGAWEMVKAVWDNVAPYFALVWDTIKSYFSTVIEVFQNLFSGAWEAIKIVWDYVTPYFQAIWETIKSTFSVVKTYLQGFFSAAWEGIKAVWNVVTAYFSAVWESIARIFSVVKSVLKGDWSSAWEAIKDIVSIWKEYFATVWDSIKNVFSAVGDWFKNTFQAAWDNIKNVFSTWGDFFSGLWDRIKNTFSSLGTALGDAIGGAVKAGLNGVLSGIENTLNSGINMINNALDAINSIPGVNIGHLNGLSLPRLAMGGIVSSPTVAAIGEDGQEAVIPLQNNLGWLKTLASQLADELSSGSSSGVIPSESGGTTLNFYQTNTSPKSLSRLEIYRQTKNQLNYARAVI